VLEFLLGFGHVVDRLVLHSTMGHFAKHIGEGVPKFCLFTSKGCNNTWRLCHQLRTDG